MTLLTCDYYSHLIIEINLFNMCSYLQSSAEIIETTAKNGVVPVATSNLKLFLNTSYMV